MKTETFDYTFIKQFKINFGETMYLVGSIPELGSWDANHAHKMQCYQQKYWFINLQIPLEVEIKFKFFKQTQDPRADIHWIGYQNSTVRIQNTETQRFRNNNLKIMSFNVRFENSKDKNQYSWQNRKQRVASIINENFPDFLGVQQPKKAQRQFLFKKLKNNYNYYGKPRDLKQDEEVGIFIRKDRFIVREDGYVWINQSKKQGVKGFNSALPRYYTYLIVQETANFIGKQEKEEFIMIVNTHLDHEDLVARHKGIQYIAQSIDQKADQYGSKLKNFFLVGDFNTTQNDEIFQHLYKAKQSLQSMRKILPQDKVDLSCTFNNFLTQNKFFNTLASVLLNEKCTIDHMFVKTDKYQPLCFEVIKTKEYPSDHFPILGTFELKGTL